MARYLVLERSFINSVLVEAGTEVEYSGQPDGNLKPLDEVGEQAAKVRAAEIEAKKAKAYRRSVALEKLKAGDIEDLL